jgi:uncharacterized membrane protein (DUF485 family)
MDKNSITEVFISNSVFLFYVLSSFSVLLTIFFSVIKFHEFFIDIKNNKILKNDFRKGINFNKFLNEMNLFKKSSSFARILLSGYSDFNYAYKEKKYNFGSPLLISKTSMKESMHYELNKQRRYTSVFSINSIITLYFGFIFFIFEIINKYNGGQLFYGSVIDSLGIMIITLLISFYSSITYMIFKNIIDKNKHENMGHIESFLKFLHKEIIINE